MAKLVRKEPGVAKRSPLAEKVQEVKDRIAAACGKAKRDPSEVTPMTGLSAGCAAQWRI